MLIVIIYLFLACRFLLFHSLTLCVCFFPLHFWFVDPYHYISFKKIIVCFHVKLSTCFVIDYQILCRSLAFMGTFFLPREGSGSQLSEKRVLQVLLDLRFVVDVLSGGDSNLSEVWHHLKARSNATATWSENVKHYKL